METWNRSENSRVQTFLDEMNETFPEKYEILQRVRKMVLTKYPATTEEIKYGGIVFLDDEHLFSGLFVRKEHVSLEFVHGSDLNDPDKNLEGTGKLRRHIKLRSSDDIDNKKALFYIEQYQK